MSVDVKVQDLPNSQKKLEICVSADECENAFQAVLTKLSRSVSLHHSWIQPDSLSSSSFTTWTGVIENRGSRSVQCNLLTPFLPHTALYT